MFRLDADKPVHFCDGMTRRDFLHAGSLAFLGLSVSDLMSLKAFGAVDPSKDMNSMMQFMSLLGSTAPKAFKLIRSLTLRPRKASEPACRKSRRVIPSQKCTGLSASSLNIAAPPQ